MEHFKNIDYYKILGVNYSATNAEIKDAYRSLARKYHPDLNKGNKLSEEKFKEIGEAYSILGQEKKRKIYDITRSINFSNNSDYSSPQVKKQAKQAYNEQKRKPDSKPEANKQKPEPKKQSTEEKKKTTGSDSKKTFNHNFSDFFDGIFKKVNDVDSTYNTYQKKEDDFKPTKGDDITADISITNIEAINGTIRKVNILRSETCKQCKGKKSISGYPCALCNGAGMVSNHKKINVKIPSNVKEGSKVKIPKEGNKGQFGGEDGDLYLCIHILKNSLFTFEGFNVICDMPITPSEAALGAEIKVPTIEDSVTMKIPPETHSGQKFRLVGEGLIDPATNNKGDQLIIVQIEIPKNLNEQEKDLYKELARIRKFNPRENIIYGK